MEGCKFCEKRLQLFKEFPELFKEWAKPVCDNSPQCYRRWKRCAGWPENHRKTNKILDIQKETGWSIRKVAIENGYSPTWAYNLLERRECFLKHKRPYLKTKAARFGRD